MHLRLLILLFVGLPCLAQVTITYDTGDTSNIQDLTPLLVGGGGNDLAGNYFTGLASSATITKVTVFLANVMPLHQMRLQDGLTTATPALATVLISNPVSGFNTVSGLNVQFTGQDVFVGFRDFSGFGIALDPNAPNHAFVANNTGTQALTGSFVLRITGPGPLPVELEAFEVQ